MDHDELVRRIIGRLREIGRAYPAPDDFATLEAAIAWWIADPVRREATMAWLDHCARRPATNDAVPDNEWARREYEMRRPIETFLGREESPGDIVGFLRLRTPLARRLRRLIGRH